MELQFEPRFNVLSRIYKHSEVIIVGILVAFYLFISNYYYWSATFVYGGGIPALPTSGGSDPYYNFVAILHILTQHTQLVFDPTLNYPLGTTNPRNPFFHWFIVLVAEILSPIYGAQQAAFFAFEEFDAVFGALLIIPVYLITREIFGKNTAGLAAMLYTLMPSNLSAGILSGGRMHTPELIFAFFAIYFFAKAIKMSQKGRIIDNLRDFRTYHLKILAFFNSNRIPSIYALLAGASLGGLMLAWQGYAYIEAILLMYVAVQLIVNLILKRPTGYVTFYTALFVGLGFLMGAYYYQALGEGPGWYNAEVVVGVVIVLFGMIIGIIGRRPWILIIPLLIVAVIAALEGMAHLSPALLQRLLSGEGYFIKTRVYDTIAEAAAPQLGAYIGGFGVAQFMLGIVGVAYAVYLYLKEKTEELLFILVFSLVSIYMSFAAARFNITAAPAYAILGAAVLVYFGKISRLQEVKKKKPSASASPMKAIRGNIKWLQAVFVVLIAVLLTVPSATFMVSASVPYGSPAQSQIEHQIANSIPSVFKTNNTTNFVGGLSSAISNGSTPLSKSFAWLSTQDANLPILDKPAYVSWWDYGFQQRYQGQHPTVADDFQQGIQIAGQTLLAQNNSQIIALFIGRVIQSDYANGNFSSNVSSTLIQYLGYSEYQNILKVSGNPNDFKDTVLSNPTIYGQYIPEINSANVYFAYVKGSLASNYPVSTLVNLYQVLIQETGNNIKYIQVPTDNSVPTLLPTSAQNTGIFYAPAYLTYSPSYYTSSGGVIPTEYYNIFANTNNGTYSLQNLPSGLIPTAYNIQFTPQFYNTSIYRFTVGMPPSAVGQSFGIPGLDYGSTQYTAMPAWNMTNFMLVYENIPFNPYKDYQAHPGAWTTLPLQQAYSYHKQGIGTVELLPPVSTLLAISDPIVAYYPGAIIHGQVTMPGGAPVPGVHVTIFDQYGVPHQVVTTNSNGYYNITGLPGNDTLYFSTGQISPQYLVGTTTLGSSNIHITNNQANRIPTSYNTTTGLPDYYIAQNLVLKTTSAYGTASFQYQQRYYNDSKTIPLVSATQIKSGTVTYTNSMYNLSYSAPLIDGNYSFSNLPPLSYEASVTTNGHTYSDFQYANVSTGGNLIYDLAVPFDTIFANLSLYGHRLPGVSVSVSSNNGYVAGIVPSNVTGTAKIWVTPGNYSVVIAGSNITSTPQTVEMPSWGLNTTVNMTPVLSASVSIAISGYNGPAQVSLYKNGVAANAIDLTLSNGRYTGKVPFGVYTISVISPNGAYLKTVTLNGSYQSNITLSPVSNLTISSHLSTTSQYSGEYELLNNETLLQYPFTANKTVTIQVPEGSYTLAGIGVYTGGTYSGFTSINLFRNSEYNLTLGGSNPLSSLVYDSGVNPSYNAQSAITSGIVLLKSGPTSIFYAPVSSQGLSQLYYPSYASGMLTVSFEGAYYNTQSVTVSAQQVSLPLKSIMSQFSIHLSKTSFSSATQRLMLTNDGGSLNFTLASGVGTVQAPIGIYYASLYASNSVLQAVPSYVVVTTQNIGNYYLGVTETSNVSVPSAQAFKLFYTNGTQVNDISKVPTGTYQLYAFNTSMGVNLSNIYVYRNTTISPTYAAYYYLTLSNSAGYTLGDYTINYGSNSINVSSGRIALPSGSYNIQYNYRLSNSTGSFTFTGSGTINLNSNSALNITAYRHESMATLSGYATYFNTPSQYTHVTLVNSAGKTIAATNTNSLGYYSMQTPTGQYTIYATNNASLSAYFAGVLVPGFSATYMQNITMTSAHYVSVSVNLGSSLVNNVVNLTSKTGSYAFYPAGSKLLIPVGNYTFASSVSKTEQTSTGSILSVSYSNSLYLYIHSNVTIPLTLNKVIAHSFKVNLISSVASISQGENVTYQFRLSNLGNNNETVTLSSPTSSWSETYSPSTFTLQPSQSFNVTLNATMNANLEYGASSIPINVAYGGGSSVLSLPVRVNESVNYSIAQNGLPVFIGNRTLIPVLLNNTGNAPVTVNFSLNQSMLNLNGWQAVVLLNNASTTSVVIPYQGTELVYVSLTALVSKPVYPMTFSLNAVSNTTANNTLSQSISITLQSPQYANVVPYPTGQDIIANYTGSPVQSLLIGIAIIAVAVVAGLAVTAYRGRRK